MGWLMVLVGMRVWWWSMEDGEAQRKKEGKGRVLQGHQQMRLETVRARNTSVGQGNSQLLRRREARCRLP